jgi:S-adenosylmethionine hydrolase
MVKGLCETNAMQKNNIITLITDFGTADTYVGTMKGVIISINPRCTIIDITHNIAPQDIRGGCFALQVSHKYFPAGTIHVAIVDPGVGSIRRPLLVETDKFFFIGPDNGILNQVLTQPGFKNVFEITNASYFLPEPSTTFHGRDIFAPVAAHLSTGLPPDNFGGPIQDYTLLSLPEPQLVKAGEMEGQILHIDRFGNLITNIDHPLLAKVTDGRDFHAKIKGRAIQRLLPTYAFANGQELFCVLGSSGYLEISVKNGSACELLKAKRGDKIKVFTKRGK